jgi:hypothetical protein
MMNTSRDGVTDSIDASPVKGCRLIVIIRGIMATIIITLGPIIQGFIIPVIIMLPVILFGRDTTVILATVTTPITVIVTTLLGTADTNTKAETLRSAVEIIPSVNREAEEKAIKKGVVKTETRGVAVVIGFVD